jgi:hypothetical protein
MFDRLLQVCGLKTITIRVARQGHIPQRRQSCCPILGVNPQPKSFGHNQYAWTFAGSLVIEGKKSPQGYIAVFVVKTLCLHATAPLFASQADETHY